MKKVVGVGVALAVAAAGCQQPSSTDSAARAAAADAAAVFAESWNRAAAGDSLGPILYGTLYWPDAELVDPTGSIWEGQPAIVQMHVDLWNSVFKGSNVRSSVRNTRRLDPNIMIADFDLELAIEGEPPPGIPAANGVVKAHLKHVMEKRDGAWKAVAAQNTFYSDSQQRR